MTVDWDWISAREGGRKLVGYIPKRRNKKTRRLDIIGESGVTIGTGIDLGQHSASEFRELGVPEAIIAKLKPYLGLHTQKADFYLMRNPLVLSWAEATELDHRVMPRYEKIVALCWSRSDPRVSWEKLPSPVQTALCSVGYNVGPWFDRNWKTRDLWEVAVALELDALAAAILSIPNDPPELRERRELESKLVLSAK